MKARTKARLENQAKEDRLKTYKIHLKALKDELAAEEGTHKHRILNLVKDLEESGEFEDEKRRKICSTIMVDLREEIMTDRISEVSIWKAIPEPYKLKTKPEGLRGGRKNITLYSFGDAMVSLIEFLSHRDIGKASAMPLDDMIERSRDFRKRTFISMSDEEIGVYHEKLAILYPLVREALEMIDTERQNRASKEKLLSR